MTAQPIATTTAAHRMTKTQRVLDKADQHAFTDAVYFSQPLEDKETPTTMLLDHQSWIEFGCPDKITVTVQAGDLLNDDPDADATVLSVGDFTGIGARP